MKKLIVLIASLVASPAFADGFICENAHERIRVKIFNHTQAEEGTRNAAIMILSDMMVASGRKTIATFEDSDSLLTSDSATYTATVDLRFANSNRKGELLLGTKLGEVKFVILDIDFSYAYPVEKGAMVEGELILKKRDGDIVRTDVACARYLKNQ